METIVPIFLRTFWSYLFSMLTYLFGIHGFDLFCIVLGYNASA